MGLGFSKHYYSMSIQVVLRDVNYCWSLCQQHFHNVQFLRKTQWQLVLRALIACWTEQIQWSACVWSRSDRFDWHTQLSWKLWHYEFQWDIRLWLKSWIQWFPSTNYKDLTCRKDSFYQRKYISNGSYISLSRSSLS